MGDAYWEETIAALQGADPLLDKPKLSEKHLTKPPFRYLHDVISGVQAKTGFAPGLFQGEELDARAIQGNKDAKVSYLSKIISVVSFALGEAVPAKPLKIVAGYEPENTNTFLVMLGRAARAGDGAAAVARVLAGEVADGSAGGAPPPKPKAAAPPPPPDNDDGGGKGDDAPAPAADAKPRRSRRDDGDGERKSSRHRDREDKHRSRHDDDDAGPPPPPAAPAPAPAHDDGAAAMQARIGRPQSARKGPPKLAQTAASGPPPPGVAGGARPGTANRGAPAVAAAAPIAVFSEDAAMDDDEVEVVHERAPVAVGRAPTDEQGVLVRDILEAEQKLKKERDQGEEGGDEGTGIVLKRLGKRGGGGGGAGAGGGLAAGVKSNDHAGIRELVQKLTQSSHPLAKSMDYLQEDLENMAKEYRFWVTERRVFQEKLGEEQRMAGEDTAADAQLADLDGQIRQARDRTIGLKAQVLRNDELLDKLLGMAVSGGR